MQGDSGKTRDQNKKIFHIKNLTWNKSVTTLFVSNKAADYGKLLIASSRLNLMCFLQLIKFGAKL